MGKINIDTSTLRIVDVVFPGSHHAGMYEAAITANDPLLTSSDAYYNDVLFPFSDQKRTDWAKRQVGSVLDQLNAGSRFLDLRLESNGGTVYAHNGLLGATLDDILSDIKTFLDASDKNDIIILSFSDFINLPTANIDAAVFDKVETQLSTYMSTSIDISTDTIDDLLAKCKVIPIYDDSDGTTSNSYVQSASSLLSGTEPQEALSSVVISDVIGGLFNGLDDTKINQIFYTVNIVKQSEFTKYSNIHDTYLQYNADLAVTLGNTIENYPKLFFGNAIIVDFVQASNAVDQAIIVNYNYADCSDTNDKQTCAADTNLDTEYKNEGLSANCDATLTANCKRSCGDCSWLSGAPGDECTVAEDCDSAIYTAADVTGATGTCYTPESYQSDVIGSASFCLAPFANADCGTISADSCDDDGTSSDSTCTEFCSDNSQCLGGYCNAGLGQCLEITTPAPTMAIVPDNECYCPLVKSETAVGFRDDIKGFRPGDPDGKYELAFDSCSNPTACSDTNPYIASVVGLALVPMVFAIIMFITYCCCCIFWCGCQTCSKEKCCKCCLGDPEENIGSKWGPSVVMAAVLIVILWALAEGIAANGAMHEHIFAEDSESVKTETNALFDSLVDRFEGLSPDIRAVLESVTDIFSEITNILDDNTSNATITGEIDKISASLDYISTTYDNYSLPATVTEPFSGTNVTVNVPCDYCSGLGSQISGISDTLDAAVSTIENMNSLLNSTSAFAGSGDQLDSALGGLGNITDNLVSGISTAKNDTNDILDAFKPYDEYREQALTAFFIIPIFWIIFWVIGVILGALNKVPKCGEWCFRCTWCPTMFIGATIMLIFAFFAMISVTWADFCVNLDDFEEDPYGSSLGQSLSVLLGNDSTSDTNTNTNSGTDTDGPELDLGPIEIINACWTGSDVFADFIRQSMPIDLDSLEANITDNLNIDVTKELSIDALDSFTSEINNLNTDEFEAEGDRLIAELNAIGGLCTCEQGFTSSDTEGMFTRIKLQNDSCHNATGSYPRSPPLYWFDFTDPQNPDDNGCTEAYVQAYTYVDAEIQLITQTQAAIDDIKDQTGNIISAYDALFGIAVGIENSVAAIACSISPIFTDIDNLIDKYGTCGFLGKAYKGFKNVGCVLLFGDMYWISCAMMVIAFLSILVVLLGFMTQYSFHPPNEDEEDAMGDFGKRLSAKVLPGMTTGGTGGRGSDVEMAENIGANDGDEMPGGEGGRTEDAPGTTEFAQPPPPDSEPPPEPSAPGDQPDTTGQTGVVL